MHTQTAHIYTHANAHICMHTCTHARTHAHTRTHTHTHTRTHTHARRHAHTHTYTHIHTYIHTYTHIHTQKNVIVLLRQLWLVHSASSPDMLVWVGATHSRLSSEHEQMFAGPCIQIMCCHCQFLIRARAHICRSMYPDHVMPLPISHQSTSTYLQVHDSLKRLHVTTASNISRLSCTHAGGSPVKMRVLCLKIDVIWNFHRRSGACRSHF